MPELSRILGAVDRAASLGESSVLATVVKVTGSGYRRPGARMWLGELGATSGSISGGCLERDLQRRAFWLAREGRPVVLTYDATDDDEVAWGVSTGCNGAVTVLVEYIDPWDPALSFLRRSRESRSPGVLATIFEVAGTDAVAVGDRLMLDADGRLQGDLGHAGLAMAISDAMAGTLSTGRSEVRAFSVGEARCEALIEAVTPPRPLVIVGAGFDAFPVAKLAKGLGWHVTVVDPRSNASTARRFAMADAVASGAPADVVGDLAITSDTCVVLMSHQFETDKAMLGWLLPSAAAYIGCLGPRYRTDRMLAELEADGHPATPAERARVFGPVGLDLGGDTPEAIALAILAELEAFTNRRAGMSLRDRIGPIHERMAT